MNRRLALLDALLLIFLALICKVIWNRVIDAITAHSLLYAPLEKTDVSLAGPLLSFSPLRAADYVRIAEDNLLSPDRNPTITLDSPSVKPHLELPFPVLSGVILLDSLPPTILVSSGAGAEKRRYHSGDRVGYWQIDSFDREHIVLESDGEKVTKRIVELMDHAAIKAHSQRTENQNGQPDQATRPIGK